MAYTPTEQESIDRRWLSRSPLVTKEEGAHYRFPITFIEGQAVCLCRQCSPAADARHEEQIQVAYVKALETETNAILHAIQSGDILQ